MGHQSKSATTETFESAFSRSAPCKIEMLFRFWAPGSKAADHSSGEPATVQHPGVLALIEDIVASKRGTFLSKQGRLYATGLRQASDALVISRQVQLGMQGFRGCHCTEPVALSIAIDVCSNLAEASDSESPNSAASTVNSESEPMSNGQEPSHDLLTLLELSRPAQVLVTHELYQRLSLMRGLPLSSFSGRFGVFEYLWTTKDKLELFQSEPQLTLAALPPPLPAPEPIEAAHVEIRTDPAELEAAQADIRIGLGNTWKEPANTHVQAEAPEDKKFSLRPGHLVAFAAVALILIFGGVLVVRNIFRASEQPSTGSGPGTLNKPPSVSADGPVPAPSAAPKASPLNSSPQAKHETKSAPPKVEAPSTQPEDAKANPVLANPVEAPSNPESKPSARCAWSSGELPRYDSLAEQYRQSGDYARAHRLFQQVLDCDRSDATARKGLDRTIAAEAQSAQ